MTVEIKIVGTDFNDYANKVERCITYLNGLEPISKFCMRTPHNYTYGVWGEKQGWKVVDLKTDNYAAVAYVDDEIAATLLTLMV